MAYILEWLNALPYQFTTSVLTALAVGILLHYIFWYVFKRISGRTQTTWDDAIYDHLRQPSILVVPIICVYFILPFFDDKSQATLVGITSHALFILLVIAMSRVLVKMGHVAEEVLLAQYDLAGEDYFKARRVHTQIQIITRVWTILVAGLAIGFVLMSFETLRKLGTGLLASAGIAGVIIGFAAQKALGNLIAGLQIAFTQPIRIDDVVVVENEWGRIEEISLTFVVVRIWDERRLVLPISYFLEKPFQNWTKTSSKLLGSVFLYLDHRVSLEPLRQKLKEICQNSEHWNKKTAEVVITNSDSKAIEVRALVSANDSGKLWNLRCHVREKLIEFIQQEYPHCLPRIRAELNQVLPA